MEQSQLFNILDSVDSTNNYAMAKVHEGLATHGTAWFTNSQTAGKGQRGKEWESEDGKNILLSIVLKPELVFRAKPFYFSAFIAICCHEFLTAVTKSQFFIKWPNDLYWNDRKAGGILIENIFSGTEWKWAVVGIGINVNQSEFNVDGSRAVCLSEICGQTLNPVTLAAELHEFILAKYKLMNETDVHDLLAQYNQFLYKKNQEVKLKKNFAVFFTTIKEVNETGQLVTFDVMERSFNFGGVQWIL
jgi:BirA family biotin operon repressor/biotin-[acetyl-CoA-carboxylase] ligase